MTIHEDLIYFLKNGQFENINFGITREKLFQILGEPEHWQNNKSKYNSGYYIYGGFEFYFEDHSDAARLISIKTENFPSDFSKEGKFIFDSNNWKSDLTIQEAINFLTKNEISFVKNSHSADADIFCWLETVSDVKIFFTNQNVEESWTLYNFGRNVKLEPIKPPTKQISFEIKKTYYEQLRTEAEKTKISIANLCREIIEKHLENKQ